MTLSEFTNEIENTFKNYTETGDIDRISIKMWVIHCLRQMGNNICEVRDAVKDVKNSQVLMPETFKSVKLALKLKPEGYKILGDMQEASNSYIYKQRIEQEAWFNHVTLQYETNCNSKIITEKILLNEQPAEFYYTPQWLSITKGIKKDSFDSECLNLHPSIRNTYPHEISVNNRTINTNFKEGQIYVQYNSLPSDEDEEVVIPEITTGDLVHYVEAYVKTKISENLIANNLNPTGLFQLYGTWKQELRELKRGALTECKFAGLTKGWEQRFKVLNQRQISAFDLPSYRGGSPIRR